jgi:hypothetical protein
MANETLNEAVAILKEMRELGLESLEGGRFKGRRGGWGSLVQRSSRQVNDIRGCTGGFHSFVLGNFTGSVIRLDHD